MQTVNGLRLRVYVGHQCWIKISPIAGQNSFAHWFDLGYNSIWFNQRRHAHFGVKEKNAAATHGSNKSRKN